MRLPAALRLFSLVLLLAFSLTASAQQSAATPLITQAVDETQLSVLKGNTHPLARPQFDLGEAPPDLPMERMLLVLKRSPAQEHALRTLLDNQQDRHSHSFHQWLKPEAFGKHFGPADQDMATVTAWLERHGFQIGRVAKGRNLIEFSGTAAQVKETFHTAIHKYSVNGKEHWANASDPQIPAALTPVVAGVHTLHNFLKQPMLRMNPEKIPAQIVTGPNGKPEVTFPGTPPVYALGPADFAEIYDLNPLYQNGINGSFFSIAVVGRSNIYQTMLDFNNFVSIFVLPSGSNVSVVLNGPDPGDLGGGEEAEATLDFSWSHAIGYVAADYLVVSATTNTTDGIDLSEAYIIDNNFADVMTESFGSCEAVLTSAQATAYASLAEQAAAQGITYVVSSGDAGAEGCDSPDSETVATGPLSVNALASTPYTIAVGGTMFNENGNDPKYWSAKNGQYLESALSYIPEDVWNESCESNCPVGYTPNIAAGSGGASQYFSKPSWQSGTGVPNDGFRDIPDVSLTAAAGHDPYVLCIEGSCMGDSQGNIYLYFVGGTSASAPSFAGIMAIVDSAMHERQGHANYILYRLAASETLSECNASGTSSLPNSTCIFNDVTSGDNAVPGEVGYGTATADYQAGVGYDLATGLGSVNAANLVGKWNSVTFNATTTTLTLNPVTNIAHGTPVNVTATVTPNSGGPATGDLVLQAFLGSPPYSILDAQLFSLSGGSVSSTTSTLPGGTYNVSAHYGGDSTFASSDSNEVSVTVSPEPSNTTLSLFGINSTGVPIPYTGGVYGTLIYPRADVAGLSGQGIATGSISFMDGATPIQGDPYALNSQANTAPPNGVFNLAPGAHSLTAVYSGDSSFNAGTSAPVAFNISQAASTVAVSSSGTSSGSILTATVNTTSGGNPPTGSVTFSVNGTAVGNPIAVTGTAAVINIDSDLVTTPASATASYTDASLKNGSYTVKAVYNGDANYVGSSNSTSINVQPDFAFSESITLVNVSAPGDPGTLSLTISADDGFNSAVSFSVAGLPAGSSASFSPMSVTGSGTSTLTITTTASTSAHLRENPWRGWAAFGGILAGCVLLGWRRKPGRPLLLVVMALGLALPSCGGGNGGSGTTPTPPATSTPTPVGSSTVTVTATSGSLAHSLQFTLTVQ